MHLTSVLFSSLVWPKSFRELRFECFYNPQPHIKSSSQDARCVKYIFLGTSTVYQIKQDYRRERSALHSQQRLKDRLLQRFPLVVSVRWAPCEWDYEQAPDNLEKKSVSLVSLFTAALQFNVSPWHGIEARVDSLMASVSTDTSKSFSVHLKTKKEGVKHSPLVETQTETWLHGTRFATFALATLTGFRLVCALCPCKPFFGQWG